MSMHSYAKESEIPAQIATQQAQPHVDHSVSAQNLQRKIASITESHAPVHRKVDPTTTVNGVAVNDDPSLEHEADVMGAQAASFTPSAIASSEVAQQEKAPNNTGLPDNLKAGIENMSGMSMDAVKVHYNSEKPAQLNALAYAQGTDIHVGPGQEQHLPHEAWHVVQQGGGGVTGALQRMSCTATISVTRRRNGQDLPNENVQGGGESGNIAACTEALSLLPGNTAAITAANLVQGQGLVGNPACRCAEPASVADAVRSLHSTKVPGELVTLTQINVGAAHPKPAEINMLLRTPYYAGRVNAGSARRCPTCASWAGDVDAGGVIPIHQPVTENWSDEAVNPPDITNAVRRSDDQQRVGRNAARQLRNTGVALPANNSTDDVLRQFIVANPLQGVRAIDLSAFFLNGFRSEL